MSPAGAWDALARLLPAECPRRDLEAVAPSAPRRSRPLGSPEPEPEPEPGSPGTRLRRSLVARARTATRPRGDTVAHA